MSGQPRHTILKVWDMPDRQGVKVTVSTGRDTILDARYPRSTTHGLEPLDVLDRALRGLRSKAQKPFPGQGVLF